MIAELILGLIDALPIIAIGSLLLTLLIETEDFRNIKKFKPIGSVKAYGHLFTFCIRLISISICVSLLALIYVSVFTIPIQSNKGTLLSMAIALPLIIIPLLLIAAISEVTNIFLDDKSEYAKNWISKNKEITRKSILMTDNEKKKIIREMKESYWADLRNNFWKYKIDR